MGWRGKLFFLLFFYMAGFATAIYCLAPVSPEQNACYAQKGFPYTAIKSDLFAKSCAVSLNKCVSFIKDAVSKTAENAKNKSAEKVVAQNAGLNR